MRLINVETIQVEEFSDNKRPSYAILSHRWEQEEVTLHDMDDKVAHLKKGYLKIQKCCQQALSDGFYYVWIDTCCIDKTSSAELSEAINSMFAWYENASLCYAYLSDVDTLEDFPNSLWFTRGWTLQELLAPHSLVFFNRSWNRIGTKRGLVEQIAKITGIDVSTLRGRDLDERCIAERMFWASRRVTTRIEDQAYCLLGIFDINMPLLYGEGEKAFVRLQQEIIRKSGDQSIFGWSKPGAEAYGLFAPSTSCFATARFLRPGSESGFDLRKCGNPNTGGSDPEEFDEDEEFSMMNLGLSIRLVLFPWAMNIYLAVLFCSVIVKEEHYPVALWLQRSGKKSFQRITFRGKDREVFQVSSKHQFAYNRYVKGMKSGLRRILVPNSVSDDFKLYGEDLYGFNFSVRASCENNASFVFGSKVFSRTSGNENSGLLSMPIGTEGIAGAIFFPQSNSVILAIALGFDFDFNPICVLVKRLPTKSHSPYNKDVSRFVKSISSANSSRGAVRADLPSLEWMEVLADDLKPGQAASSWNKEGHFVYKVDSWGPSDQNLTLDGACVQFVRWHKGGRHPLWHVNIYPIPHHRGSSAAMAIPTDRNPTSLVSLLQVTSKQYEWSVYEEDKIPAMTLPTQD